MNLVLPVRTLSVVIQAWGVPTAPPGTRGTGTPAGRNPRWTYRAAPVRVPVDQIGFRSMSQTRRQIRISGKRLLVAGGALLLAVTGSVLFLRDDGAAPAAGAGDTPVVAEQPGAAPSGSGASARPSGSASPSTSARTPATPSAGPGGQPGGGTDVVWPSPATTGVPAGWRPKETRTTDLKITRAGAVVKDIRLVNADLIVAARNVKVQRVELQGGSIINDSTSSCGNGLVVENVTLTRAPGRLTRNEDLPAIQAGGYTARRVKIDGRPEGFRVAGKSLNCGRVTIESSFARVVSPDVCGDWHGDGIQGYDGPPLVVRTVTLELVQRSSCGGTAPFFYPAGQGNTSVDVDGVLVKGGGYPFRLAMPGSVRNLRVVDRSWEYGPIDVDCSLVTAWDATVVTVGPDYQPIRTVRQLPCNTG